MQEWLNDLAKPSWWGTVFVAGILVNLLAAYAKPVLDSVWSRLSQRRREASTERLRAFNDAVERVIADPEEFAHLRARRMEARFQEVACLFWAILVLVMTSKGGPTVLLVVAILCMIGATVSMREADRFGELLNAAHKKHVEERDRRRTTG